MLLLYAALSRRIHKLALVGSVPFYCLGIQKETGAFLGIPDEFGRRGSICSAFSTTSEGKDFYNASI